MIKVENLRKAFRLSRQQRRERGPQFTGKEIEAVAGISFTCRPGRIFCLLGPNGAGKTTTLRIIATMLKPTGGRVAVAGHDVMKAPRKVRRNLGFLTGATALYDRLTPEELVRYYADLHGIDRATFEKRRDDLFGRLGVHDFANRRIAKLSTGMKQKVSIVRTMIHDPQVVVLDEATAGLDVIAARSIIRLVRRCREQGKTVIFSTHRMDEVSLLADDLAIIHEGRLLYEGAYDDFERSMQDLSLEEAFIRVIEAAPPERTTPAAA